MDIEIKEACPVCECEHKAEPVSKWKENGEIVFARPDVDCICGNVLRWIVPIFKETKSGYVLRVKQDYEQLRRV